MNTAEMADLIIEQQQGYTSGIGSVIKVTHVEDKDAEDTDMKEETTNAEEEGKEFWDQAFGFISIVNIHQHKVLLYSLYNGLIS